MLKLFEGQRILQNHLTYNALEFSYMSTWIRNNLCPTLTFPQPELNQFTPPNIHVPVPSTSSSSGASSPSYPTPWFPFDETKGEKKRKKKIRRRGRKEEKRTSIEPLI
jgi:hypothetical protein